MHPIHLCIGAPRAGASWLFREMGKHPGLFVPLVKEVRFWNSRRSNAQRDAAVRSARTQIKATHDAVDQKRWIDDWARIEQKGLATMQAYCALMSVEGRPSLDISPSYCFLPPKKIKELRESLPDGSKVLYLLRDPMPRLASQVKLHYHLHGMYRGRPSHDDLAEFLDTPNQQKRWDYASILNSWGAEFGDDFIALPFDDVVRDPKALTYQVADFLGFDIASGTNARSENGFFHVEKNQNSQLWVTSLSMVEKRQMAKAMVPAMETFADEMPQLGKPWLTKLTKIAEHEIQVRASTEDVDLPTQKLMRMTESLGDNCEYGMWNRHRAYEPSSLFRWAITPIDSLLRFLDAPGPLYSKEDLTVHSPGMVSDASFGFKFHSKLVELGPDSTPQLLEDKKTFDDIHADEYGKVAHLQAKFFVQMKRQTGLYVIKDNKGMQRADVDRVLAHLRKHNPTHHLLWVESDGEPGFTDLGSGLLRASLPRFAPYTNVHDYAPNGWTELMIQLSQHEPIAEQIARMQR